MNRSEGTLLMRPSSDNAVLLQNTLFSAEAQRVSKILSNCIRQVEIAVNWSSSLCLETVPSDIDSGLSTALKKHLVLTKDMEQREDLEQEPLGNQDGNTRERWRGTKLDEDFKDSVRNVFRLLQACPAAEDGAKLKFGNKAGSGEEKLTRSLEMFHSHMLDQMMNDGNSKFQSLKDKWATSLSGEIQNVISQEEKVTAVMKQTDALIDQKMKELEALEKVLQQNAQAEEERNVPAVQVTETGNKGSGKQTEIDQLNTQLYHLMIEHRQTERTVQEQNEKVEKEIEEVLYNFEEELKETQAKLELNEEEFRKEEEEVRKLQEPFSLLEQECNKILERRRLDEEKQHKEMKELELKTKAALKAQAWWRGFSTRNALRNKGKAKKAKKAKGKKAK